MSSTCGDGLDAEALEREAAALLAGALAQVGALHLPGARERHRRQLECAIVKARRVLAGNASPATLASARVTLARAHAARAQDARHGAGQLSRGAQRAPTPQACNEGWRRVEAIVATAEASAAEAAQMALALDRETARMALELDGEAAQIGLALDRESARMALEPEREAASQAARTAAAAAAAARQLVEDRNHAYTFHADPGFSFGEGWYLAAAALLAGVAIQLEPNAPQTASAERFLGDAGLRSRLTPYRCRPRANKQLTAIVAEAFRAEPAAAQRTLRAAFLGEAPIPPAIIEWTDRRLAIADPGPKVLLWVRHSEHHPLRNTMYSELVELTRRARAVGLLPVLVGDAIRGGRVPDAAVDLTLFWKEPLFSGHDLRRAQLQLFEYLRRAHALKGQLGVTTAGMDGPALLGLPTLYLTDAPNVRMRQWVGAIPGYRELVRDQGYLDRISEALRYWAECPDARPPCPTGPT